METARDEILHEASEAHNSLETPGACKETLMDVNEQMEQPSMNLIYTQR